MNADQTVCVTGASGFIGAHIVRELLEQGFHVRGIVRRADDLHHSDYLTSLPGASQRMILVGADPTIEGALDESCAECAAGPYVVDVVDPQKDLVDPTVKGILNTLASCVRAGTVKRIVFTSSMAAISDEPRRDRVFTESD